MGGTLRSMLFEGTTYYTPHRFKPLRRLLGFERQKASISKSQIDIPFDKCGHEIVS